MIFIVVAANTQYSTSIEDWDDVLDNYLIVTQYYIMIGIFSYLTLFHFNINFAVHKCN